MILAIGGAGCNMAGYCLRNASSKKLKNAQFLFANTDVENISRLTKMGYDTIVLQSTSAVIPLCIADGVDNIVSSQV